MYELFAEKLPITCIDALCRGGIVIEEPSAALQEMFATTFDGVLMLLTVDEAFIGLSMSLVTTKLKINAFLLSKGI